MLETHIVRALLARLWPFSAPGAGGDTPGPPDEGDPDAPGGDTPEDDERIRTWDFVPDWQYDGWQVQNGGLSVAEQERALAEIRSKAEAIGAAEAADGEAMAEGPDVADDPGE